MQSEHTQKDDIINDATLVVATGCASIAGVKPVNGKDARVNAVF